MCASHIYCCLPAHLDWTVNVRKKGLTEMPRTAKASFEIQAWDEQTYQQLAGDGKLTKASVRQLFSGDIVGSGSVELHGLSGEGEFRAPLKSTPSVVLNYVVK